MEFVRTVYGPPPQDPVISNPPSRRGPIIVVLLAVLAMGLVPVVFLFALDDDGDDDASPTVVAEDGTDGESDAGDGEDAGGGGATEAELDMVADGPGAALGDLADLAGAGESLASVVIYDTYLVAEYRDPENPVNLDRVVWRDDMIVGPDPAGFADDHDGGWFAVSDLDPDVLAALVAQALVEIDVPGGEVSHVVVQPAIIGDRDQIEVNVYVRNPERGGGGYLSATLDGTVLEIYN